MVAEDESDRSAAQARTVGARADRDRQRTPGDHAVTFQLFDPRGAKVVEKRVLSRGGMATNDFALGAGIPGGAYVLRATSELGATLDRAVVVSSYEAPRIKKTLDFLRKSYGPGEEVSAHLVLEKPTGEPALVTW